MDLLYSKYSSPLELMHLYIDQGRFGEFVTEILKINMEQKQDEAEKEDEQRLWELYLHSMPELSFSDWKEEIKKNSGRKVAKPVLAMNDEQITAVKNRARGILKEFSIT